MIFRAEYADLILAERKTVTRRPAKGPCRYTVGKDYSVQPGRGKHEVGRILVIAVSLETLGFISARLRVSSEETNIYDWTLEGFDTLADFRDAWRDIYGGYDPAEMVYRIEFEVV